MKDLLCRVVFLAVASAILWMITTSEKFLVWIDDELSDLPDIETLLESIRLNSEEMIAVVLKK